MGMKVRWFWRRPSDDEMQEELETHVAMRAEHDAVNPAVARRRLGNTLRTREAMRRVWIAEWWDALRQDAHFTWRSWRRQPGFALGVVLVLALGLGASTAMFSALDRMLFRPLPYADADRLMNVGMTYPEVAHPDQTVVRVPSRGYTDYWKPTPAPFVAVTTTAGVDDPCDITEQQPERLQCAEVESNFLQTFGVPVAIGRDFGHEDDERGAPSVAIISHRLWSRRFGTDPGVIGRTLDLDGKRARVIGVLPANFEVPAAHVDILRPQQQVYTPDRFDGAILTAFGRLRPGVTPRQAEASIASVVEATARSTGRSITDVRPRVMPLRDYLVGDRSPVAWLLLGAVAGLLLIACVNVTNLILARLAARDREFALRSALGAGRGRLARLAITESVLLAVTGGGAGLVCAAAMLRVFARLAPSTIPEIDHASLNLRVLVVATTVALAVGGAVGIWPALSVLRRGALQYRSRATAPAHPRMRFTLVTVQIALTLALLVGSTLLMRTLSNLLAVPLGYQSRGVITMEVAPNVARYTPEARGPLFERLLERIREIPGTATATMSTAAPPTGVTLVGGIFPVDHQRGAQPTQSAIRVADITPGYFQTFDIPIRHGRAFVDTDRTGQPVVILSQAAARMLFPGQDPIGHTVRVPPANEWAEVVGVAGEVRNTGPTKEPVAEIYSLWRRTGSGMTAFSNLAFFAIRMRNGTADAAALLRQAVADVDPQLPVTIQPVDAEVARLTERPRFVAWLLSAFAALALLLAATGLHGLASYLVTQRSREFGVRAMLGAAPADLARQVVGEAGRWIAAGATVGALLAWGVTRAIHSQLFAVGSADPASWAAAFVVLGVALLAAVVRPAARAARVDPIVVLKVD